MPSCPPKALLFDLGGVLVDIDFSRAIQTWTAYSALSTDDLRARFKHDKAYEQHERGEIQAAEYFAHLSKSLELSATLEQIEHGWNSIFVSEIVETRMMIQTQRQTLPCYAFTNTNPSHQSTWSRLYPGVVQAFDQIFASHKLGMRKPEAEAFMRVCQLIRTRPVEILFFDDLPENVDAALNSGLQAVLVRSPQDVRAALSQLGAEG